MMPRIKQDAPNARWAMQVVNYIRGLIEKGTLHPGDRIPPERELAQVLKISRASLRTGIGYLAAMGVMKVRHGVGTFVADGPSEFGNASSNLMGSVQGFQSWQMFEARLTLEGGLAAFAAERGKEEHHIALAEELFEMFATVDSPTDYLVHDVLFHRIIAQASGNPILAVLMETVASSMYDERRINEGSSADRRESTEMHLKLYRAIRARNAEEARKLMEQHLLMAQAAHGIELAPGRRVIRGTRKKAKVQPNSVALTPQVKEGFPALAEDVPAADQPQRYAS
jgi:GntR family transcriptional regulator, transcriptional repressor for pyruvate dehydrogenase complex